MFPTGADKYFIVLVKEIFQYILNEQPWKCVTLPTFYGKIKDNI